MKVGMVPDPRPGAQCSPRNEAARMKKLLLAWEVPAEFPSELAAAAASWPRMRCPTACAVRAAQPPYHTAALDVHS